MEEKEIFTEEQKKAIKATLAKVLVGRGKVVEDISKEINNDMFSLTDQQIKNVDNIVEAFVYGGGIQEQLSFLERLDSGLDHITQKLLLADKK